MLIGILLGLVGLVVLILIAGVFLRKNYRIQRQVVIDVPLSNVFDYIKQLRHQDHYNKWVMVDPEMKKELRGTDGTVGFVYKWDGNKRAGAGEQEIKSIAEGKKVDTEIRFERPFKSVAYATMVTEPLSHNQTKLIWSNESILKYPMNILLPMIENMLGKDMDTSLASLKRILEK